MMNKTCDCDYHRAFKYIQHLCESSFVRTCDEQPSSLRFDELNAKINKLDQEIFKLQMAQNRNPMATLMDEKQFILLQNQNELLRGDVLANRTLITEALKAFEDLIQENIAAMKCRLDGPSQMNWE